jgi:hypothetical protein
MPQSVAYKPIDLKVGQRVLFRCPACRPVQWLSGAISGGPKTKFTQLYYLVKFDNGESRWAPADQIRKAGL